MAQKYADLALSELTVALASGGASLTVADGSRFPLADAGSGGEDWFKIVIQSAGSFEIIYVQTHTAGAPNTLGGLLRGQEGTTALAWPVDSRLGLRLTSADAAAFLDKVDKVSGKGLSTEDYSTTEKSKLEGIQAGAVATATLSDEAGSQDLPGTSEAGIGSLLQTVRNCLKWLLANTLQLTGAQTAAGVKTFSSRSSHAGAYTPSLTPAHSATPTFNCAASNSFEPGVMTSNVTSLTMSNPVAGQTVQIIRKQDATGGRTHAVPSGAKIDGSINTGANRVSILVMTYYGAGSMWIGNWLQIPA